MCELTPSQWAIPTRIRLWRCIGLFTVLIVVQACGTEGYAASTDRTNDEPSSERKDKKPELSGLDNTPEGGTLPGGTVPGGTLPGGTLPGGTVPGGTVPGGTLPGGTLPDETVPGGTLPGGTLPGGTVPSENLPGEDP